MSQILISSIPRAFSIRDVDETLGSILNVKIKMRKMGHGYKIMITYPRGHPMELRFNVRLESNKEVMSQPTNSQFLQRKGNPHFPNQ